MDGIHSPTGASRQDASTKAIHERLTTPWQFVKPGVEHHLARSVRMQADTRYSPDEIFGTECAKHVHFRRFVLPLLNSVILHTACRLVFQDDWWLVYRNLPSIPSLAVRIRGEREYFMLSRVDRRILTKLSNTRALVWQDLMNGRLGKLETAKLTQHFVRENNCCGQHYIDFPTEA